MIDTRIHQELLDQGFRGGVQMVRRYLRPFRASKVALPPVPLPPKPRHVTRWIMADPDKITTEARDNLDRILARSPVLTQLTDQVRTFAEQFRRGRGHRQQNHSVETPIPTGPAADCPTPGRCGHCPNRLPTQPRSHIYTSTVVIASAASSTNTNVPPDQHGRRSRHPQRSC